MLKKVLNITDYEEERKLQIRRQVEEERKQRIFNASERTIGIDVEALGRQTHEKIAKKMHEKEIEQLWQQETLRQQSVLDMQAEIEEQRRRDIANEIQHYRSTYQLPEFSREFDLNDPQRIIKDQLNNANDTRHTFGVSSGQFFDGEDLSKIEREQRQREQQKSWLMQQKQLQTEAQQTSATERSNWYTDLRNAEAYRKCMENCIENERAKNAMNLREFNMELAKKKIFERQVAKLENEEDNRAEIINMMASDLLCEENKSKMSQLKETPSFIYHDLKLEEQEIYEAVKRKELIKQKAKAEEEILMRLNDEHAIYIHECERKRIELLHKLNDRNLQLAQEQREQRQREEINSRNVITDEFFNKFNTTSR